MNKKNINCEDIRKAAIKLTSAIKNDNWKPDLIIAVTRGGLFPAGYLSYYLNVSNIQLVKIQTYENTVQNEKKLKKCAADVKFIITDIFIKHLFDNKDKINILIVDDLTDSGNTLKLIDNAINEIFLDNEAPLIKSRKDMFDWRFGVLYNNENIKLSKRVYYGEKKPNGWLVFPWDTEE